MDKKKVLVVIDVQNDFVTGALRNEDAIKTIPNILAKVREYIDNNDLILLTKDTHYEDTYMKTEEGKKLPVPHCIIETEGWRLVPELTEALDKYVTKRFYKSSFGSLNLGQDIGYHPDNIESVEIIGFCTDICVISNALIIKSALEYVPVYVDAACCAGTSREAHSNAVYAMTQCHIDVENFGKEPWRN